MSCQKVDPNKVEDDMRCPSEHDGHFCGRWHWHPKDDHKCHPCGVSWPPVPNDTCRPRA